LSWNADANYGTIFVYTAVLYGTRGSANQTFQFPDIAQVSRPMAGARQISYVVQVPSSLGEVVMPPVGNSTGCSQPVAVSGCPEDQPGIVKWSSWSGAPSASAMMPNVTIAANEIILLDVSPPVMNLLSIFGQLVVDARANASITLQAQFIYVQPCGHFFLGSEACPALGEYDVVLVGPPLPGVSPDGVGTKVLAGFPGSQIDIHGAPLSFAWTVRVCACVCAHTVLC
jgi:hypothetical protein